MNWRYETWRKLYVREEGSFAALRYTAKALAGQLLKICDDKGRIYPREGEDIRDSICFRLGMDRGERRLNRPAVDKLLEDGHLVLGERGSVRIKNFLKAHEGATTAPPADHEPTATAPPPSIEPVTNRSRPSNEDCVKPPELLGSGVDVPSVPFRSVPAVPSDPAPQKGGGVPQPAPPYPEGGPVYRPQLRHGFDTQRLLDTFGRIRSEVTPGFAWNAAGQGLWENAAQTAKYLEAHPEAVADVEPTMRRVLEKAKDSQDPKDHKTNVLFGRWASTFSDERAELHGLRQPAGQGGDKPCFFHSGRRNTGQRAPKHDFRAACAECRHLDARAGPRSAGPPQSIAEVMGGISNAGR